MSNPQWPNNPFAPVAPPTQGGTPGAAGPVIPPTQAQMPAVPTAPGGPGAFNPVAAPPGGGAFGAPPSAGGAFGAAPPQGGSPFASSPPAGGAFGAVPPQGGAFGGATSSSSPFGAPPPAGGAFGAVPPQGGSPFGAAGAPPGGGFGPPQGNPYQPMGGPGPSNPYAAGNPFANAPIPRPGGNPAAKAVLGFVVVGALVGARVALRTRSTYRPYTNTYSSSTYRPPTYNAPTINPAQSLRSQQVRKVNEYIDNCLNPFTAPLDRSRLRYYAWVSRDSAGPTGRERQVLGIPTPPATGISCTLAVSRASTLQPRWPEVESNAQAYSMALNQLLPVLNLASNYYSTGMYRSDRMMSGRVYHPQIVQGFTRYLDARRNLMASLDAVQEQMTQEVLTELRADPSRHLLYLVRLNQNTAKRLIRMIDRLEIDSTGQLTSAESAQVLQQVTQYTTDVNSMLAFAPTSPQQRASLPSYGSYEAATTRFMGAAQAIARRIQTHQAFSPNDIDQLQRFQNTTIDGSTQQAGAAYDQLVNAFNAMFP